MIEKIEYNILHLASNGKMAKRDCLNEKQKKKSPKYCQSIMISASDQRSKFTSEHFKIFINCMVKKSTSWKICLFKKKIMAKMQMKNIMVISFILLNFF